MSAPQTNLEKQKRRHRGPLIGMTVVTIAAVLLIVYWIFEEIAESDPPRPTDGLSAPESQIAPDVIPPGTSPSTAPAGSNSISQP